MNNTFIDGKLFRKMMHAATGNLYENVKIVNELNVFPIPDGDTGENMYLTLKGGIDELDLSDSEDLDELANALSRGMLLGARGNSGVILSQLFYGLSQGLKGLRNASIKEFKSAMEQGVKYAYKSVSEPVEGTILTVARESVENVDHIYDDMTPEEYFKVVFNEMKKSLENTPELLQVLKEAGVIDSGGAGLLFITEGFCKVLAGFEIEYTATTNKNDINKQLDFSLFDENSVMEYGYCTEVLLRLQTIKCDVVNFNINVIVDYLNTIGDSVVAVKNDSIVKIHVHTLTPWKVLAHCQQYGEFLTTKIENMTLQHNEQEENKKEESILPVIKKDRSKYALVAVVNGKGLVDTFSQMGADYVIDGGQTNNPSSEEFIKAFNEVNADNIFVLPNNSNIILTAKQAKKIYKESNVIVIETKNIGQGYSALSMLDYGLDDVEKITNLLNESFKDVVTGMIAKSVRDANLNNVDIKLNDYMGFTDKTMLVSNPSKILAACELCEKINLNEKSFMIISYGKSITDLEKEEFSSFVFQKYPFIEVYEIDGGQDVYDIILISE